MTNKTYDTIKNLALLVTPIVVFASSLVSIWDIPYGAEITSTLAAVDALAGAIVVVASKMYKEENESEQSN